MGQKSGPVKEPAEQVVKAIRRTTRRQFSAEEKIRIVLSGLRGEDSIAEPCREGIVQNLYYRWSKEFLEAGKKVQRWRCGGPERPPAATRSRVEPNSGRRARQRHRAGTRRAGAVAARAGGAVHRQPQLFRLRGFGLPPAEGARPDRQSGLYRDQGGRCIQG